MSAHPLSSIGIALPADRPPPADLLTRVGACADAVEWSMSYDRDWWRAWDAASMEHMIWLCDRAGLHAELRDFARWCARSVIHLWDPPAPEVVVRYLETGDETIRGASREAARAAAWDAARGASRDAARAAAWDAARGASRDAARAAARDAAWAAARDAAWDATRQQRAELRRRVTVAMLARGLEVSR